jgi:hypothetical protein
MGKDPRETGLPLSQYFDEAAGFLTGVRSGMLVTRQAAESRITLALVETEEKVGIT